MSACPHCGYCPHCGHQRPVSPFQQPMQPWGGDSNPSIGFPAKSPFTGPVVGPGIIQGKGGTLVIRESGSISGRNL